VAGTSNKVEHPRGELILAHLADALAETYAVGSTTDTDHILRLVATVVADRLPVTCVAVLIKSNPERLRVVHVDHTNPGLAEWMDAYDAAIHRSADVPTHGISQGVIETGAPVLIPRISIDQLQARASDRARQYAAEVPPPIHTEFASMLMVPMRAGPAIVGTLSVYDWQATGMLSDKDIDWMQRAGDRAGIAIENAQMRNKAVKRSERISAMSDVALAISSGQELRVTFNLILERIVATLGVEAADILLIDEGHGGVTVAASTGFRSGFNAELRGHTPSEAGKRWVIGHNVAAPSAIDWIGQSRRWMLAREGLRSYTAAPLTLRDRFAGALEVFSRADLEPDEEWLAFLDAMATQAAIALDSAAAHESRRAAPARTPGRRTPPPELSEREMEILRMVVEGASNREVAEKLHLSQNTIKFHVRQLLEKAEVANRTELATRALQQGWV
jgi:GAF domain-containing protein